MKLRICHGYPIAAIALCCTVAPSARADDGGDKRARVSLDIDYALALGEGDTDHGAGGALRLGYLLGLAGTSVTPEVGLAYHGFDGSLSPAIYSAFAGGRMSFSGFFAPGLYARFGIAHANEEIESHTVPTFGAGFTLDVSPVPILDVGLHTGYEVLFGTGDADAFDWWAFGGHAGVAF